MRDRGRSIRSRVIVVVGVPLAGLIALWIFATSLTLPNALDLRSAGVIGADVGISAGEMQFELGRERATVQEFLAKGASEAALAQQELATDTKVDRFRELVAADRLTSVAGDDLLDRIDVVTAKLNSLVAGRERVHSRSIARPEALRFYTDVVETIFDLSPFTSALADDAALTRDSITTVYFSRAEVALSEQDALIRGAAYAGRLSADEHVELIRVIAARQQLFDAAISSFPADLREQYRLILSGPGFSRLRAYEDRLIDNGPGIDIPITAASWTSIFDTVIDQFHEVGLRLRTSTVERSSSYGFSVLLRLTLAGGIGLLALALTIVASIRSSRTVIHQLSGLRKAAEELAMIRLPQVVSRLRRGEVVDVAAESRPLAAGADEIGAVGAAFNDVSRTAIQSAVDEANLRRGINDVFVNIARRSQALLHRQLALLDTMERKTTEAEDLEALFRVDHLATRMRRHAEDLVVLAGASPGRGWRSPVPLIDVIRGAVSETEDYARVDILAVPDATLAGRAVSDVIHLLAGLVENATSFSPPHTRVTVTGELVSNGYVVEIEDRGLGMDPTRYADTNARLAKPPDFDPSRSAQLGLFVVAKLASRHGVTVTLRPSPFGGVTAVTLIPSAIVNEEAPRQSVPDRPAPIPQSAVTTMEIPRTVPPPSPPRRRGHGSKPADGFDLTSHGLPRRVRPTSTRRPSGKPATVTDPLPDLSPERLRARMSALQAGTARGRQDAELATGPAESADPSTLDH
jgi:hypothetical protein